LSVRPCVQKNIFAQAAPDLSSFQGFLEIPGVNSTMKWQNIDKSLCLNLISAIILLVGLSIATLIYLGGGHDSQGIWGYEGGNGAAYPISPEDSKQYLRDLELYGGKANVLADQFRRWFSGLWHGKSLALIVACTTIIISFGFFYAANYRTSPVKSKDQRGPHGDSAG